MEFTKEIELKVAECLKKNLSIEETIKEVKTHPKAMEVGRFLYNAHCFSDLFDFSLEQLKSNKEAPWPFVIRALLDKDHPVSDKASKVLFDTFLNKQKTLSSYWLACKDWECDEFQNKMQSQLDQIYTEGMKKNKELLEELHFVQKKNLIKEEEEIIEQLLTENPHNPEYKNLKKELAIKKALNVIEKHKYQYVPKETPFPIESLEKINSLKKQISKDIQLVSQKNPKQTKDLAIFLYNLGWTEEAIEVLTQNIKNIADYWFYLDWLVEGRQYATALDILNQLLNQVNNDPDAIFSITYIKAEVLYFLGRKDKAIAYMNDIIKVRPKYKNAQYLLEKWLNE